MSSLAGLARLALDAARAPLLAVGDAIGRLATRNR